MERIYEKYEKLKNDLKNLGSAAVAFSAGVDSTFLLYAAHKVLKDQVIAVTAESAFCPRSECQEAAAFCTEHGIRHVICPIDILSHEEVTGNPPDRCYLCKTAIFRQIIGIAQEQGIDTVIEGSNKDDDADYRPGKRAILELEIKSPLAEAGLTKGEIRLLSEELGLPTAHKPSMACLASRIPYGETITKDKLVMAEKAEDLLKQMGFHQYRVRIHGNLARIELLPEEISGCMEEKSRQRIVSVLKDLGFAYVSLDLEGYRTGSLNETL